MAIELTDKVVFITGGAQGLGRAIADLSLSRGARLALCDIDFEVGQEAAARIQDAGGEAIFVEADVAEQGDVAAAIAATLEHYGRIDCAVNNAGVDHAPKPLAECTEEMWDRTIAINLKGVFLCMRHELTAMVKQGSGAIVNMASVAGLGGAPTLGPYAASKHGVVGLTRTAAVEYAKHGIRVNAVCPSYTRTDMLERLLAEQPELEPMLTKASPMRRFGEPDEIAATVAWLCSDDASFINGQAVAADGGLTAW